MTRLVLAAVVGSLMLAATGAHAQSAALNANAQAMAAAAKAGDRAKLQDLQRQRQALMAAQEKLDKAASVGGRGPQ